MDTGKVMMTRRMQEYVSRFVNICDPLSQTAISNIWLCFYNNSIGLVNSLLIMFSKLLYLLSHRPSFSERICLKVVRLWCVQNVHVVNNLSTGSKVSWQKTQLVKNWVFYWSEFERLPCCLNECKTRLISSWLPLGWMWKKNQVMKNQVMKNQVIKISLRGCLSQWMQKQTNL